MLVDTFVDAGPLFTLLGSADHQIVYGRRGTGKTHALQFLFQDAIHRGDVAVYIDLRTVGSNVSVYSDPKLPLRERGSRLLADVLAGLHDQLVDGVNADGIPVVPVVWLARLSSRRWTVVQAPSK